MPSYDPNNIFALRVGFRVARDGADEPAAGLLGEEVHGLPAGAGADRAGEFEGGQKIVRYERIVLRC